MCVELVIRALHTQIPKPAGSSVQSLKLILTLLCEHANSDGGSCFPSHKRLKQFSGMGNDAVNNALKALQELGFIKKKRTQSSNQYLICVEKLTAEIPRILRAESQTPVTGISESDNRNSRFPNSGNEPVIKPVIKPVKEPVIKNHTIPDDFTVTDEMKNWFAEKGFTLDLQEETEEFIEYWKSEGGKKKNWQLTWKNRMRDQQKRYGASKPKRATKARPENFANKDYGETKVNF